MKRCDSCRRLPAIRDPFLIPLARLVVVLVAIALLAVPAARAVTQEVPVGPRALAMGGAFTAIGDDASGIFWNPGALVQVDNQELSLSHADLYDAGLRSDRAAFVLPITRAQVMAVDWYRLGYDDTQLQFAENRVSLACASRIGGKLALGLAGKLVDRSTRLEQNDIRNGSGFGLDVGLHSRLFARLRVGLLLQDALKTAVRYEQGGSAITYSRNLRAGMAYDVRRRGMVAMDFDDRWHFGTEIRPIEALALRGGAERDLSGVEGVTWTVGMGARVGSLRFDWALVSPPVLPATSHFGVSFAFNFNPSLVRVDRVDLDPIYSSLGAHYASEDGAIGNVVVSSKSDDDLPATLSVSIPGYTPGPFERTIVVPHGSTTRFGLRALLGDAAATLSEDRRVPVEVHVRYQSLHLDRGDGLRSETTLHRSGSIDWSGGLDQAAAFVTPRDPVVETVGRAAGVSVARSFDARVFPSEALCLAAAAVDAIGTIGVAYVRDPLNPYDIVHNKPHAVDTIYYPRQTLAAHAGDCDDSGVLVASVLGNVGIHTRIVDAPDHLFLLADTELEEGDLAGLPFEPGWFVPLEGTLWIPLETTRLNEGFEAVWRQGADVWSRLEPSRRAATVDVTTATQKYPAIALPTNSEPPRISPDSLAVRFDRTCYGIAGLERSRLDSLRAAARDTTQNPVDLNTTAGIFFRSGRWQDARDLVESGLRRTPDSQLLIANLAAVMARQGQLREALDAYLKLAEGRPTDPSPCINLSLLYAAVGDSATARRWMEVAVTRAGGVEQVRSLLRLHAQRSGVRSLPGLDREAAVRQLVASAARSATTLPEAEPVQRRITEQDSSTTIERLIWAREP